MPLDYQSAVASLYALGHELAPGTPRRKWELSHMRTLCAALGNPQHAFPSILIAGTNGKGSTAATLASILQVSGLRTGLYTSPHLERINERVRINGLEISDEEFARLYFRVFDAAHELVAAGDLPHPPSFFEAMTALAFAHFAQQAIQIAVLEVGLGGRLDATNIVQPLLSVITDIALDHTEYLGSTIAEIAREKAGILRPHGTLVTLPQHPEANQSIGERAIELTVTGINAAEYLPARAADSADALPRNLYLLNVRGEVMEVDSPLAGVHQQRNLALAIASAVALSSNGYSISTQAISDGIRQTHWAGRLEFLATSGAPLLLDAAHNPAAVWSLRSALARLPESKTKTLIFSCLRDKALTEMAQILFPLFSAPGDQILIPPITSPRAASVDDILAVANQLNIRAATVATVPKAVEIAVQSTVPHGIIVAAGSVYLAGAVRTALAAQGPRALEREEG